MMTNGSSSSESSSSFSSSSSTVFSSSSSSSLSLTDKTSLNMSWTTKLNLRRNGLKTKRFSMKLSGFSLLLVLVLAFVDDVRANYDLCYDTTRDKYLACSPPVYDVTGIESTTVTVEPATSTCGNVASQYKRLGDFFDTTFTCDASDSSLSHPPGNIVDSDVDSWWQSVSPTDSSREMLINIDLKFNKMFRMSGSVVITFNYARPDMMVLERSVDNGTTWIPQQYFARFCSDFRDDNPSSGFSEQDPMAVVCSNRYVESSNRIVEGRNVVYDLDERFGLFWGPSGQDLANLYNSLSENVLDDLLFTDLRLRLIRLYTDGSKDYDKFFYAIQDMYVMARCFCNLHAHNCTKPNGKIMCNCAHNTEGDNCERCMPLYNERLWSIGSYDPFPDGTANECLQCECNSHALSCTFNATYGRGICDECLHNTQGYHCENCMSGYYPNISKLASDVDRCVDCNCNGLGVDAGNTVCNRDLSSNLPPGQCVCKSLVTSRQCDQCIPGHYGLFLEPQGECKACGCDRDGTTGQSNTCAQEDGQCPCKASTTGRQCNQCADTFFNFPTGNPAGECTPCGCDMGGSTSQVCDKVTGRCECKQGITGDKCDSSSAGTYVPVVDILVYQPASGDCQVTSDLWTSSKPFDGAVFALCELEFNSAKVIYEEVTGNLVQRELSWPYYAAVRYTNISPHTLTGTITATVTGDVSASGLSPMSIRLNTPISPGCPLSNSQIGQAAISFPPGQSSASMSVTNKFEIDARCTYRIELTLDQIPGNTRRRRAVIPENGIQIDSVTLLPSLMSADNSTKLNAVLNSADETATIHAYENCLHGVSRLTTRSQTLSTAACQDLLFTVASDIHNGVTDCGCDANGANNPSQCQSLGGQCSCKNGVGGQSCDTCLPGYFNLTVTGCQACECYEPGSATGSCDVITGQCPCKSNIMTLGSLADGSSSQEKAATRTCRRCNANYYGLDLGNGCSACVCSSLGSTSLQCDDEGQCPCKETVQGLKCDVCKDTFYNFGVTGCTACGCDEAGSTTGNCDQASGVCTCKANTLGDKCDTCQQGHFNLASYNPDGCQKCFCFEHSTTCTSAPGFELSTINLTTSDLSPLFGSRHTSYGRVLSFSLTADFSLDISGENLVSIEGSDGSVIKHMARENTRITRGEPLVYQAHLFEHFWQIQDGNDTVTPTPIQMYRTLADITAVTFITNSKGQAVRLSGVSLEIPLENAVTTEPINFVESCSCLSDRNVQGLSCEQCGVGHRRPSPESASSYQACVACDCNGRGVTAPPQCEEVTGTCLNCRNGTMGDSCQDCAPFVTGSECDTCQPTYWGLSADGCAECGCSDPGSKNAECNRDTGQCDCADNVDGRTCDKCQENFYSLTSNGCIECDACYSLLKPEIAQLRASRDILASNVSDIVARDAAFGDIEPFVQRFQKAVADTAKLINFLDSARDAETELLSNITNLRSSLETIQPSLVNIEDSSLTEIEDRLSEIDTYIQKAQDQRTKLVASATQANAKIVALEAVSTTLKDLANNLQTVQTSLETLAQASSSDKQLLEELSHLDTTSHTSNTLASALLKRVQEANRMQQNTTAGLIRLESEIITLMAKVTQTLTSARSLSVSSQETTTSAAKLQTNLAVIQAFSIDFPRLTERTQNVKTAMNDIDTELNRETLTFNTENVGFQATNETVQDLTNRTDDVGTTSARLWTRASKVEQSMLNIQENVNAIFASAESARDILADFSARAAAIEADAQSSLDQVVSVRILSQKLINESQSLSQVLFGLQQIATSAYGASEKALQSIQPKLIGIQEVANKASELDDKLDKLTPGFQQRASLINTTRQDIVDPSNNTCHQVKSDIVEFQSKLAMATESADTALITASNVTTRANEILRELRGLQRFDTTAAESLLQNVETAEQNLNADDVRVLVNELLTAKSTQEQDIERLTAQRDQLQAKVEVLQGMLQQIRPSSNN